MDNIIIVDDDKDISVVLKKFLTKKNYNVTTVETGDKALKKIKSGGVELVICDFELPSYTGIELLQKIKILNSSVQVIIVTNYSSIKLAVEAVKKGAFDYVTKPLYPEEILFTIEEALEKNKEKVAEDNEDKNNAPKKEKLTHSQSFIIGKSYQSQMVEKHIDLIAPTDMSVLISGETGVGKEYVARSIHNKSNRANQPFVAVDCGAIPTELAGSELFGHVKGAFTGAINDKKGCFERANKGTLFLDEIGNLNYENQVQLLRVLQEQVVKKVGGTKEIPVNIRVLAATNEDLKEGVRSGDFREDIYHRLNEFKIELAPLRERPEDIEQFARHFLNLANGQLNKNIEKFDEGVMRQLKGYYWHGNLRELRNAIKRAVLICQDDTIETSCLPIEMSQSDEKIDLNINNLLKNESQLSLKEIAEHAEKGAILEVLKQTNNNKSKTAKILQIDRKTLYNKMKSFEIDLD